MTYIAASRDALADAIRAVTDLWDEPLDEVHDVPQIADALIASGAVVAADSLADDAALDAAIARIEESRDSHVQWRDHLDACGYCTEHPPTYIQTRDEHAQIVEQYDGVLHILRALSTLAEKGVNNV